MVVNKINRIADDNFLYVHMIIKDLLIRVQKDRSLVDLQFANTLYGVYANSLNALFGNKRDEWINTYSKILGLLTVQQGEGFNRLELEKIIYGDSYQIRDITAELRKISQFVIGKFDDISGSGRPSGPFRIFHKSFADYLTDEENNKDYLIDQASMHQKIVDYYLTDIQNIIEKRDWSNSDDYSLRYLTHHLYAVIEEFKKSMAQTTNINNITSIKSLQVQKYSKILFQLARSKTFREAQKARFPRDNSLILSSTDRAISVAVTFDNAPAIAEFMIEHARAISEIKQQSPLETLRNTGNLENAWNIADLYDIEICTLWYFPLAWSSRLRGTCTLKGNSKKAFRKKAC